MNLQVVIETSSKKKLLQELKDIVIQVEAEINDPICKGCKSCKDLSKGCFTGGGSSGLGIESKWNLSRKKKEHSKICKSKQVKLHYLDV